MIAVFSPRVREDLDDVTINAIVIEVAGGVSCAICGGDLAGDVDGRANVIAFRQPGSASRSIRYADVGCAPSQLIDVPVLPDDEDAVGALIDAHPTAAATPVDAAANALSWALSTRIARLPTIILVVDVDRVEDLPVHGDVLLKTLQLDGFRGGRDLETLDAPFIRRVTTSREGETLTIHTRHGSERLALTGDQMTRDALHLAAVQRQLLLVVSLDLDLQQGIDEADRRLAFSGAIAAAVPYMDAELAALPLWGKRRHRIGRALLSVTPSSRRERRERRRR